MVERVLLADECTHCRFVAVMGGAIADIRASESTILRPASRWMRLPCRPRGKRGAGLFSGGDGSNRTLRTVRRPKRA